MDILIVEDDRVISLMLRKMVERLGHNILDIVTKGEDAVNIALNHEPGLILMDIMLEDEIDGIEAIKQIKDHKNTPVIYVTGNSDSSTMKRAKETDYIAYLIKPVVFNRLEEAINRIHTN